MRTENSKNAQAPMDAAAELADKALEAVSGGEDEEDELVWVNLNCPHCGKVVSGEYVHYFGKCEHCGKPMSWGR